MFFDFFDVSIKIIAAISIIIFGASFVFILGASQLTLALAFSVSVLIGCSAFLVGFTPLFFYDLYKSMKEG